MDVQKWAEAAHEAGAVVFLAVHEAGVEDGGLQEALTNIGVPHTGTSGQAALTVHDKVRPWGACDGLQEALTNMGVPDTGTSGQAALTIHDKVRPWGAGDGLQEALREHRHIARWHVRPGRADRPRQGAALVRM